MSEARRKRRNENYNLLRSSGFNSLEATKYKDLSRKVVKNLCVAKRKSNEEIEKTIWENQKLKK